MNRGRSAAWVVETLSKRGVVSGVVHGGYSMSPCLLPGDRLTFRALAADEARVGDILVVDGPFGFVVHRLIAIGDGVLWLRGDANTDDDAAVSWAQVIGRVCAATRKTRQISLERRWLRGAFAKAFAEVRRRASA